MVATHVRILEVSAFHEPAWERRHPAGESWRRPNLGAPASLPANRGVVRTRRQDAGAPRCSCRRAFGFQTVLIADYHRRAWTLTHQAPRPLALCSIRRTPPKGRATAAVPKNFLKKSARAAGGRSGGRRRGSRSAAPWP